MERLTQKERVLRVLQKAKAKGRGVHSFWGYRNYIPRMGAVIYVLKQEGYNITSKENKKDNGCTYFLDLEE